MNAEKEQAPGTADRWWQSTLFTALIGSLLMWAALPPLAMGWLGWIAPVPWLLLVRWVRLPGRRPYPTLWLAGLLFWLAAIHWLRLPHPAVYVGWVALSAYLACYLPVFVGLSRVAVHRFGVSLWLAAPVVWTGLELLRAHLMTGFLMGSLAHTQAAQPVAIQISDLVGEYGVDFVMVLTAACITCVLFPPRRPLALVPAIVVLGATVAYGYGRLGDVASLRPGPRIALIQGNSLADWKADPAKQQSIMEQYIRLSQEAVARAEADGRRPIDLIVWPETMFRSPLRTFASDYRLPADVSNSVEEMAATGPRQLAALVEQLQTPVLVGIDRVHFLADKGSTGDRPRYRAYNSAVLVDADGQIVGTYDKVHLVMFGEYVPLAEWLPMPQRISSITGSAVPGAGPATLCLDDVCYGPSICYETVIPHVIRRLAHPAGPASGRHRSTANAPGGQNERRRRPDVLVNLTNDAWYWGSSELDMHLASDVFRAVETRLPLVIAANGGISAWIDPWGRVRARSPRMQSDVILADVELTTMRSPYARFGDWFAGSCLAICVALAVAGWRGRHVS